MRYYWFARPIELLLDLDSQHARELCEQRIEDLCNPASWRILPGNSENHFHGFVTLRDKITPLQHASLAITLGSDEKRESANVARYRDGATKPICLIRFQPTHGIRKPDMTCTCPENIIDKNTGLLTRLRACIHLREYAPHHWKAGTLTQMITFWIPKYLEPKQ